MGPSIISFGVRQETAGVAVIDVDGDVTPAAEPALMHAYGEATSSGARVIVLDFRDLAYMNSGGIGLLVTLLVRAQRSRQRLRAFGLSDHYRQVLSLTPIDDAIDVFDDEASALAGSTDA